MSVLVNPWPISVAIETCLSPSKGDCGRVTIKKKKIPEKYYDDKTSAYLISKDICFKIKKIFEF